MSHGAGPPDETINQGPVSHPVWIVGPSLLKAMSAKSRYKFAALSPIMVTAAE
jgi:hypothetical protein